MMNYSKTAGTTSFERGIFKSQPTLKCRTEAGFSLQGTRCIKVTRQAPNCGSGIYDPSEHRCKSGGPFSLPTGQNPCNMAAGFHLEGNMCVKREVEMPTKECNMAAGFHLEGNMCVKREVEVATTSATTATTAADTNATAPDEPSL